MIFNNLNLNDLKVTVSRGDIIVCGELIWIICQTDQETYRAIRLNTFILDRDITQNFYNLTIQEAIKYFYDTSTYVKNGTYNISISNFKGE